MNKKKPLIHYESTCRLSIYKSLSFIGLGPGCFSQQK